MQFLLILYSFCCGIQMKIVPVTCILHPPTPTGSWWEDSKWKALLLKSSFLNFIELLPHETTVNQQWTNDHWCTSRTSVFLNSVTLAICPNPGKHRLSCISAHACWQLCTQFSWTSPTKKKNVYVRWITGVLKEAWTITVNTTHDNDSLNV